MALEDRERFREDRKRRAKLVWNERSGEMQFDREPPKRRFRWPYRLRQDLPRGVKEIVRVTIFLGAIALALFAYRVFL